MTKAPLPVRCRRCDAVLVYCPMWAGCKKCPQCERHTRSYGQDGKVITDSDEVITIDQKGITAWRQQRSSLT